MLLASERRGRGSVDIIIVHPEYAAFALAGVACAQLSKAFTGVECERAYFDIACERIARAQAQGKMFPDEPRPVQVQQVIE